MTVGQDLFPDELPPTLHRLLTVPNNQDPAEKRLFPEKNEEPVAGEPPVITQSGKSVG